MIIVGLPLLVSYNGATQLDVIKQQGELRVITRLSPTTYFTEDDKPGGFEYELAQLYADFLGVDLNIIAASDIDQIYEALRLNNAHLAAAGLTQTPDREKRFDFSPAYLYSQIQLVYLQKIGNKAPKSYEDLSGTIEVMTDSSHAELLASLPEPRPQWQETPHKEVIDLLESVSRGALDYTLVDSGEFSANKVFFPRLRVAFSLSDPKPVAWVLKQRRDTSIQENLQQFFSLPDTQNELARLQEKYFQNNQSLNFVDNITFRKDFNERLPKYKTWFEQASEQNKIDWQLLAAIGYQESHWNPKAISPTGVRGLMMLTRATAKEVGVTKRTDPEQSIRGGGKYFAQQKGRIPDRITEPDRTWFALATYNVGRGHLEDARILTQRAGMNADKWEDVAKHLPLLSQQKWYKTVKHGFARGREPVLYVNNIRRYIEQLEFETRLHAVQRSQAALEAIEAQQPIIPDNNPASIPPETL